MSELGQPPPLDGGAVFNKARELWNELELPPECRDLIISIPPVRMQEVLSTFQKYSCDEVLNAIRNYNWHRKKLGSDDNKGWRDVLNFGSLIGFLKTGVEKYFDDEGFEKLYKKGA